ncbi:IclR family transcriptional regulator [Mesorhizobium sp. CAU 1741]|uniref:IclR family transcriptional regulator n=1 Tax=Mesorhizobium sp. CAU 1741 TaxID=3140366 RepID=UPI00325B711F
MNDSDGKDYTIAAVDRAMTVLEALGERSEQGVTDLSKTLGMTKSLVFRLLHTLEARGFVTRDPNTSTFSLGYRVGVLGERMGHHGSLVYAARPVMEKVRDQTSETVNLVIREGTRSLNIANKQGHHSMRIYSHIGHGPLYAGGGSLVVLAHSGDAVLDQLLATPLEQLTPKTVTEPEKLRLLLARIRAQGYNIALDDMIDGAFAVAAPIRDSHDEVIAALSIAGASVRFTEETRGMFIRQAVDGAAEISAKLSLRRG